MLAQIQIRRDTITGWATSGSTILSLGEIGIEFPNSFVLGVNDSIKFKVGDGNAIWNNLPYYRGKLNQLLDVSVVTGSMSNNDLLAWNIGTQTYNSMNITTLNNSMSFLGLLDTPNSYSGQNGNIIQISGNQLIFAPVSSLISKIPNYATISYSELSASITTGSLQPGIYYKLIDYQTIHNILDYDITTGDLNSGSIEPLFILATSTNSLASQVYSQIYPQDIIHYDWTGGDNRDIAFFNGSNMPLDDLKGVITYREDTTQNVSTFYDFRNIKFRRWEVNAIPWTASAAYTYSNLYKSTNNKIYICKYDHSGSVILPHNDSLHWLQWLDITSNTKFWSWTSNKNQLYIGNCLPNNLTGFVSHSDYLTFGDYYNWVQDVEIGLNNLEFLNDNGYPITRLNNIVFLTTDTLYTCYQNKIASGYANTILTNFFNNNINDNFIGNFIGTVVSHNNIDRECAYNSIQGLSFNNTILTEFISNTIDNNSQQNYIGHLFNGNYIGNNFLNNNIDNITQRLIIGNLFQNNTIKNCINLTIGGSVIGFGNNVQLTTFNNNCFGNATSSIFMTSSTILSGSYDKEIYLRPDGVSRLRYYDEFDNTVITDVQD